MSTDSSSPSVVVVPVVHWSQSSSTLSFKVSVREADRSTVGLKVTQGNRIQITARTKNEPDRLYQVELSLYGDVIPSPSTEVLSHSFSVTFAKLGDGACVWPRLLQDPDALDKNKIKVDWDLWADEDEETEGNSASTHSEEEKAELRRQWSSLSTRGGPLTSSELAVSTSPPIAIPSMTRLRISYLIAYNMFTIACLFLIVFFAVQTMWIHFHPRPPPTDESDAAAALSHQGGLSNAFFIGLGSIHARLSSIVYVTQFLASLEVVHSAVGLIPGRVLTSFLLNGGRDIILFGCIASFTHVQSHWSVGALYVVWAIGDLVRYTYYLMQLVQSSPAALLIAESWLSAPLLQLMQDPQSTPIMSKWRYTLPLVLLPFGFAAELMVLSETLPHSESVLLPGDHSLADLLQLYRLLAYLLGAPFIYIAVWKQRKNKVDGGGKKKKSVPTTSASSSTTTETAEAKKAQ